MKLSRLIDIALNDPQPPTDSYRGRFAPSPTGRLHFGSLLAAIASYVDARSHDGTWLIRMEDLDPPREVKGAASDIIEDLQRFGMTSDEPVMFQSQRHAAYQETLNQLLANDFAFDCGCTRKDLIPGKPYPGTCAEGLPEGREARSVRLRVKDKMIRFHDRIQGPQEFNLTHECGAFIIRRADGLFAYQLAVVVDDERQKITDVMRGADLLDSTPRQIQLQSCLGFSQPRYAHHPVVVDALGNKLSKQSMAQPVDSSDPMPAMNAAWAFLGQKPLASAAARTPDAFLKLAVKNWRLNDIPRRPSSQLRLDGVVVAELTD